MYFFTEPNNLILQTDIQAFGPVKDNVDTQYKVSSGHTTSADAKIFACQDALMLIQPYVDATSGVVDTTKVNIVLKPIEGLDIRFSPVKYYVYRGIEASSFLNGTDITPKDPGNTEFITKFWENWESYQALINDTSITPSPKSLGFDITLKDDEKKVLLIEELYSSEFSDDTFIQDFQSIKVEKGIWIGNVSSGNEFEFEIITDTDHVTMDLEYFQKSQIIITSALPGTGHYSDSLESLAQRETILNYVDPVAFYGMHFSVGFRLSSFTGSTRNPTIVKKEKDLVVDVLSKFLHPDAVYLDLRGERGYSYYYYYHDSFESSIALKLKEGNILIVNYQDLDYSQLKWPIINLKNPPVAINPITNQGTIDLKLVVSDNLKPIIFSENVDNFDAFDDQHFVNEKDLNDPLSTGFTNSIELSLPLVEISSAVFRNVANHVKLYYFKQEDAVPPLTPPMVFKNKALLDSVYGGIHIAELNVKNKFGHYENAKKHFVTDGNSFAYAAHNGVFLSNDQVMFYADKGFSYLASTNVYPKFNSAVVPPADVDAILKYKNVVLNKWKISDGTDTFDILGIVGFNRTSDEETPKEDLFLLGITKTELETLDAVTGVSDLHHKYFVFTELLDTGDVPFTDTLTGTSYKKYRLDIQGIDAITKEAKTIDTSGITAPVFVYGTNNNVLSSKDFAAALTVPNNLPDPGEFTKYDFVYRHEYEGTDSIVHTLFPGGTIDLLDNRMAWESGTGTQTRSTGIVGELFYPVNDLVTNQLVDGDFPLIVILHANGGRYTDYRNLANHLAKNGFVVNTVSGLYSRDRVLDTLDPISSGLIFTNRTYTSDYEFFFSDSLYVYLKSSTATPINSNYEFERLTQIQFMGSSPYTVTGEVKLSWTKGVDFDIYVTPKELVWKREGANPGIGLNKFGLSWTTNTGTPSNFSAKLTKDKDKLVELSAAEWSLSSARDIQFAILIGTDIPFKEIPFPATTIDIYLGTQIGRQYYMIRIKSSIAAACSAGTCVDIVVEVKNSQLNLKFDLGKQGMGILGRSNLALAHIQVVRKYMEDNFGNVLQNNIGLIGHSRGAEAVVRFNKELNAGGIGSFDMTTFDPSLDPRTGDKWNYLPDDLNQLNAVISLAPTDASKDGPDEITSDTPYSVTYGSMDGDVEGATKGNVPNRTGGFSLYDRAQNKTEKAMTFVHGATHNGFITNNKDYPSKLLHPPHVGNLISPTVAKKVPLAYMNAFMRKHLKEETIWNPYFFGDAIPQSIMHSAIYPQYRDMNDLDSRAILDFDNHTVSASTSVTFNSNLPKVAGTNPADIFHIGSLSIMGGYSYPHDTKGIKIKLDHTKNDLLVFILSSSGFNATNTNYLSFRIGKVYNPSNSYSNISTATIIIEDLSGNKFERFFDKDVPDPHKREVFNHRDIFGNIVLTSQNTKSAMITMRIPLLDYADNGVNLSQIKEITFVFPGGVSGEWIMDDIEFAF